MIIVIIAYTYIYIYICCIYTYTHNYIMFNLLWFPLSGPVRVLLVVWELPWRLFMCRSWTLQFPQLSLIFEGVPRFQPMFTVFGFVPQGLSFRSLHFRSRPVLLHIQPVWGPYRAPPTPAPKICSSLLHAHVWWLDMFSGNPTLINIWRWGLGVLCGPSSSVKGSALRCRRSGIRILLGKIRVNSFQVSRGISTLQSRASGLQSTTQDIHPDQNDSAEPNKERDTLWTVAFGAPILHATDLLPFRVFDSFKRSMHGF